MPEVLRIRGHRFFFWSNDRPESPHIHVETAENKAKFWLNPVRLARMRGYNERELREIEILVRRNEAFFLEE